MLAIGLGLAAAPTGAGATDTAPPLVTTLQTVLDGVGDVLNTVTSSVFDNSRADITAASVEYAPGWIRMKMQLKTPTDPLRDKTWSDKNDAEWAFDTNGDGKQDYTVEFATRKGELYGAVFDAAKPDDKSLCDADSASYSPQDGYTLVIDPKCIGNPKALGYAVTMYFNTDPKDDKDPVASDRVPDQGFKAVVAPGEPGAPDSPVPSAGPAAPGAPAANAPGPIAPRGAASLPKAGAAPGPVSRPGASAPAASGTTMPGSGPAGASGGSTAAGSAAGSGSAAGEGAAAGPANLARTGSASEKKGLLGLGLMLLGAGLLVMTRPIRRAAVVAG